MSLKSYYNLSKNMLFGKLNKRILPSFCTYAVTWKCNLQCSMCSIWRKKQETEMTIQEIEEVFSRLSSLVYIRITGGEPFTRPDLMKIADVIKRKINPEILHITTNGFYTDEIEEFLKKYGDPRLHLKISIDGNEKIHDDIRGMKGAYGRAVKTIIKACLLKKENQFNVGINYTINPKNCSIEQFEEVYRLAERHEVGLYFDFAYLPPPLYSDQGNHLKDEYEYFKSHIEPVEQFFRFIKTHKLKGNFVELLKQKYYLKGFQNRIIKDLNRPRPHCVELQSHLRILPNGNIPVCLYDSTTIGNLLESGIGNVWHNHKTEELRRKVKKCAGCWAGCEVGPNAIFTGDIIKALWY